MESPRDVDDLGVLADLPKSIEGIKKPSQNSGRSIPRISSQPIIARLLSRYVTGNNYNTTSFRTEQPRGIDVLFSDVE